MYIEKIKEKILENIIKIEIKKTAPKKLEIKVKIFGIKVKVK